MSRRQCRCRRVSLLNDGQDEFLPFSLSPVPISLNLHPHLSSPALSTHYRESPEVGGDNPSSAQLVFHVLGRLSGSLSIDNCISFLVDLFWSLCCFPPMSFIWAPALTFFSMKKPVYSAGDKADAFSLCLDAKNVAGQSIWIGFSTYTSSHQLAMVFP